MRTSNGRDISHPATAKLTASNEVGRLLHLEAKELVTHVSMANLAKTDEKYFAKQAEAENNFDLKHSFFLPSGVTIQGSAKECSLGCVIPASWLPLAAGARFT